MGDEANWDKVLFALDAAKFTKGQKVIVYKGTRDQFKGVIYEVLPGEKYKEK